jgi:hypothetical protein
VVNRSERLGFCTPRVPLSRSEATDEERHGVWTSLLGGALIPFGAGDTTGRFFVRKSWRVVARRYGFLVGVLRRGTHDLFVIGITRLCRLRRYS